MTPDVIIVISICATTIIISALGMFYNYVVQKEKIKADIAIKTEEIKAKNQLEIEKLMYEQNPTLMKKSNHDMNYEHDMEHDYEEKRDERQVSEKI